MGVWNRKPSTTIFAQSTFLSLWALFFSDLSCHFSVERKTIAGPTCFIFFGAIRDHFVIILVAYLLVGQVHCLLFVGVSVSME